MDGAVRSRYPGDGGPPSSGQFLALERYAKHVKETWDPFLVQIVNAESESVVFKFLAEVFLVGWTYSINEDPEIVSVNSTTAAELRKELSPELLRAQSKSFLPSTDSREIL